MSEVFGIPTQALFGQLAIGVINGSFYALMSLGLAVIFGLLNVINFAHGAQYMMGAFCAWIALTYLGLNYWFALVLVPLTVGITGMLGGATQTPLTSAAASTVVITVGVPVGTPPLTSDSVTVVVSTY